MGGLTFDRWARCPPRVRIDGSVERSRKPMMHEVQRSQPPPELAVEARATHSGAIPPRTTVDQRGKGAEGHASQHRTGHETETRKQSHRGGAHTAQ